MAVNATLDESFARGKKYKWPNRLETVEKPCNPPGEVCFNE